MIGLFFGDTDFPKLILKSIKKRKKKYFIIDLSKNNKFKKNKKCKKVIFAGKINKPKFSQLKLDITGIYYIPRIIKAAKKGDAAILKELIKILFLEKIKVISSTYFNPELSLKRGNYSKLKPNKFDLIDIKKGIKILQNLNSYDHVQAVIVRNKIVEKETSKGKKK